MSKRTPGLPRAPLSFYPTPPEAVLPLVPYLPRAPAAYVEPCAGDGALVRALAALWPQGVCALASDLAPRRAWIEEADAREVVLPPADLVITNPPWPAQGARGEPSLSIIRRLSDWRPTWMLLPWSYAANGYFGAVHARCAQVVPIGRVSWMGNGQGGYDDAAWLLFDGRHTTGPALMARAA